MYHLNRIERIRLDNMTDNVYIDTDVPKVFISTELQMYDKDSERCESCGSNMNGHDWVLLGKGGYVIFCSIVYHATQINKLPESERIAYYAELKRNGQ